MNTYYTMIFFAFILFFLNSSIAYRIYSSSHEQDQENIPESKRMMIIPNEGDFAWPQYISPTLYHQMLDRMLLFSLSFFFF